MLFLYIEFSVAKAKWREACGNHPSCLVDESPNASSSSSSSTPLPVKRVIPNRHVTVFGYLNSVGRGGETVFPLVSEKPACYDFFSFE